MLYLKLSRFSFKFPITTPLCRYSLSCFASIPASENSEPKRTWKLFLNSSSAEDHLYLLLPIVTIILWASWFILLGSFLSLWVYVLIPPLSELIILSLGSLCFLIRLATLKAYPHPPLLHPFKYSSRTVAKFVDSANICQVLRQKNKLSRGIACHNCKFLHLHFCF